MFKLSIVVSTLFFSGIAFAACLPPSTNETGCQMNASQLRAFKTYLGCRQDNYHDYCRNLVEKGVGLPGIGFLGTSSDRRVYARKLAEKISKSKELTGFVVDAMLAAGAIPPGLTKLDDEEIKKILERMKTLVGNAPNRQPMSRELWEKMAPQRERAVVQIMASPRTTLEPALLAELKGNPEGYLGYTPEKYGPGEYRTLQDLINDRPPAKIDFPDEHVKPDYSGKIKLQERMAERASGLDFEGDHPDLKAMREAKEARAASESRALRELPQMTKKEVTAVAGAMSKRMFESAVIGGAVAVVVTPLVELVALSYEDRYQKRADCAGRYPFVPTTGRTGNSADGFTCRPTPFPDLSKKDRFLHSEYPKEIGMFLSLPEEEQVKLMNVQAGKYFGICDYYSRAFSDAFTGTKYCTGGKSGPSESKSSEGKTN